jgi:GlcNAc-P-P-Und epimerase
VVHAAGKAHSVPRNQAEAREFFAVNLDGTRRLARGLEQSPALPSALVFVSTVSVYGLEQGRAILETHPLKGTSPYAQSKIEAEAFLEDWGRAHGVRVAILRLPLIAGPDAPGNLGAMVRGLETGRYLRVGSGTARKSMVLATDLPGVLPRLAEVGGTYHLTDGHHPSFAELETALCRRLGRPLPPKLPLPVARLLGRVGDLTSGRFPLTSATVEKMTQDLTFDDSKAKNTLGWRPRHVLDWLEAPQ